MASGKDARAARLEQTKGYAAGVSGPVAGLRNAPQNAISDRLTLEIEPERPTQLDPWS